MHAFVDAFAFAAALGDLLAWGADHLAKLTAEVSLKLVVIAIVGWLTRLLDGR